MAGFGKKGISDQGGSGRIDRHRPVETGLMPERNAPRFFYHDVGMMFWGLVIGIALVPIVFFFYNGEPLMGSWYKSAGFVAFGIAVAFYLRHTGQLDDKPESDLRGFFLGGPWFLGGSAIAAGVFFWFEGIAWIWSYDLTKVNLNPGIQQLSEVKKLDGLAGFLSHLANLLIMSLAGGAVVKQLAVKIGIDEPFSNSTDDMFVGKKDGRN